VTALDRHRFVLIERDDAHGGEARQKKIYLIDLRWVDAGGYLRKTIVLDLLAIPDPDEISLPARPGEFGVGTTFSFSAPVRGEPRSPRRQAAAHRERQQLPEQRRPLDRP
jgi:hypothetical protein